MPDLHMKKTTNRVKHYSYFGYVICILCLLFYFFPEYPLRLFYRQLIGKEDPQKLTVSKAGEFKVTNKKVIDFTRNHKDYKLVPHAKYSVVEAESLVPETWEKISNHNYNDPYGNLIRIFSRSQTLVIDMYLGGFQSVDGGSASTAFSPKFCSSLMQNVVQPLASVLNKAFFTNGNEYMGDAYCSESTLCIRNISLREINNVCNYCTKEANKLCGLILVF